MSSFSLSLASVSSLSCEDGNAHLSVLHSSVKMRGCLALCQSAGKWLGDLKTSPTLGTVGSDWEVLPQLTIPQELSPSTEAQPQGQRDQGHLLHEAEAVLQGHGPGEPRDRGPGPVPSSAASWLACGSIPGFHPVSSFANGKNLSCPDCRLWVSRWPAS